MPSSGQQVLGITLTDGVSRPNFYVYLLVALITSGLAGLLAFLEPGLWQIMGISEQDQPLYTSRLRGVQEIYYITLMGVFGALSDKLGRPLIYAIGLTLISVGLLLYPHATSITDLVIYRSIIGVGGAAMMAMLVAVIADYTIDETRGRANGIQAFAVTMGALVFSVIGFAPIILVKNGFTEIEATRAAFSIAGGLGLLAALFAYFGLSKKLQTPLQETQKKIWLRLKEGLQAAKDPRIALSYGAAFISRGDLAVTGAFMGLWISQYAKYELGMETSAATALTTTRVLVTIFGALIGSIIMGYIFDRFNRITAVTFASGFAGSVYLMTYFVDDPSSYWVMGLLFLMGIAEISGFVGSQALVGQYAPKSQRGVVIGFFGVAGAIGILIGSVGGGQLYRSFGPSSPFILFGFLNLCVFFWSLRVNARYP